MSVETAGTQFKAKGRFGHNDPHEDRDQTGDPKAAVCLRIRKEDVHPQLRRYDIDILKRNDIANLPAFCRIFKFFMHIKPPCHQIGCDPVGPDTGDNFIDVEKCFEQSRDGAPQRAQHDTGKKRANPRQP